jgi:uncharacterized protein YegP (UPF0339 family)
MQGVDMAKFTLFVDRAKKYRFNLKASNGEIIAASEAYNTKAAALKGIKSIQKGAPAAKIEDLDPDAKVAVKKPAGKKAADKKPAAKKPAVKKPAVKKAAGRKPAAKKPAAPKAAAKKPAKKEEPKKPLFSVSD